MPCGTFGTRSERRSFLAKNVEHSVLILNVICSLQGTTTFHYGRYWNNWRQLLSLFLVCTHSVYISRVEFTVTTYITSQQVSRMRTIHCSHEMCFGYLMRCTPHPMVLLVAPSQSKHNQVCVAKHAIPSSNIGLCHSFPVHIKLIVLLTNTQYKIYWSIDLTAESI